MTQDIFNQSYFNTTGESGQVLKDNIIRAKAQDSVILKTFEAYDAQFTASDIHAMTRYLLTSVRRSINTLWKAGKIVRTGKRWNKDTKAHEFTYTLKK